MSSRMDNAPDDWDNHYRMCRDCGSRYHASEGGCECEDDDEDHCDGPDDCDEPDDYVDDCPRYYDGTGSY